MLINTNEVLYKLQKTLSLSLEEMIEAYKLEEYEMDSSHLQRLLKRRQDKEFMLCSYEELGVFLDGLIALKRGKIPKKPDNKEVELSTNLILKKLRIVLELKEAETEIIFGLGEVELTKQQLASLFRKEGHKNFKPCSSELLMAFIDGLEEFYFVGNSEE